MLPEYRFIPSRAGLYGKGDLHPSTHFTGLFLNLIDAPLYAIIIGSVIAVVFYFYKNKERKKVEEQDRGEEEQEQEQTMALRLRQPAFTVATTITTILVAILLVDSYILINPYLPASLSHDVGDLTSARMGSDW